MAIQSDQCLNAYKDNYLKTYFMPISINNMFLML